MNAGTDELIHTFQEAAVAFGKAFEEGDSTRGNEAYNECEGIHHKIRQRGDSSIDSLIELLDSDEPWVRYAAAAFLLDVKSTRATAVLHELKNAPKGLGVAAFITLRNWDMNKKGMPGAPF
jgi:hypothetical protein